MLGVAVGFVALFVGIYILFFGSSKPPEAGESRTKRFLRQAASRIGGVVLTGIGILLLAATSFVFIDADKIGHLKRIYAFEELPPGRIIALEGQKGPQARILGPGFHFIPLIRVLYDVEQFPVVKVAEGFYGEITALDGQPMPENMFIAPVIPDDKLPDMLKANNFIRQSGIRGPQETVLKPGNYRLNRYLFQVKINKGTRATLIPAGHVGVVKSNVQRPGAHCVEEKVAAAAQGEQIRGALSVPLVPRGCVGIWKEPLFPGAYYLNRRAYQVTLVDTRVRTWIYKGGFVKRIIDLSVDQQGNIKQRERSEQQAVPKNAADPAVFVKIEGWDIPLELRALVQISPENAPVVVGSVGAIEEIENRILTPAIRSIVRNVAGSEIRVREKNPDGTLVVPATYQGGAADQGGINLFGAEIEGQGSELQDPIVGDGPVDLSGAANIAGQGLVLDLDALRLAGGTRRVDDIRQVTGRRHGGQRPRRPTEDFRALLAEMNESRPGGGGRTGQPTGDVAGAEHPTRPGVAQLEDQPIVRILGIQRQVCGAGFEHGEQRHDHLGVARQGDPHHLLGTDSELAQMAGQPVATPVELTVGQNLGFTLESHRRRRAPRLQLEKLVDRPGRPDRHRLASAAPFEQELLLGPRGQQTELGYSRPRTCGQADQEPLPLADQPGDGRAIEDIEAVLHMAEEPAARLAELELQVELGPRPGHRQVADLEVRQPRPGGRRILEHQHHLEERCVARIALELDGVEQFLEGHVLVGIGLEGDAARLVQDRPKTPVALQSVAQHQGVDEKADQAGGVDAVTIGDEGAHRQVALPGDPVEQYIQGRQEHHEQAGVGVAAGAVQRRRARRIEPHREHAPRQVPLGRTRSIRRQGQHGRGALELAAPVVEHGGQRLALEPPPLPRGKIGVLHHQLRQGDLATSCKRRVAGVELLEEDPHGPTVRGDVVEGHEKSVLGRGKLHQGHARQGAPTQVKGPAALDSGQPLGLAPPTPGRQGSQVHPGQGETGGRRGDHLHGLAAPFLEGGAQGLVTPGQRGEGAGQGQGVEGAAQQERGRHIVGRGVGLKVLQHPLAQLREGNRQGTSVPRRGDQGRCGRRGRQGGVGIGGVDPARQIGQVGGLEKLLQGHVDRELPGQAGLHLGGEQRVAAELEEIVVHADLGESQQLAPDVGDGLLDWVAGSHEAPLAFRSQGLRRRQGPPVHLAVGRQRQALHQHEGRRHHGVGESLAEEGAQLGHQAGGQLAPQGVVGVILPTEGPARRPILRRNSFPPPPRAGRRHPCRPFRRRQPS